MRPITLTTDFGLRDGFAGVMKGILLRRAPRAAVIDLTHEIPPGDLQAAAFVLMASYIYFPQGTVHLVVVDPGVGTNRSAVAVKSQGHFFVGPDNGVLSWAAGPRPAAVVELENPRYRLSPVSRTFHGRDIFAPAAAALAAGTPLGRLGRRRKTICLLPFPRVVWTRARARGEGLVVDRFGNLITNIAERPCRSRWGLRRLAVRAGGRRIPVVDAYGMARRGAPLAVFGSSGFLEISVREGRADQALRLKAGSPVSLFPS